jgi:hypothetical protein
VAGEKRADIGATVKSAAVPMSPRSLAFLVMIILSLWVMHHEPGLNLTIDLNQYGTSFECAVLNPSLSILIAAVLRAL